MTEFETTNLGSDNLTDMNASTVLDLVKEMDNYWKNISWYVTLKSKKNFYESGLLRLNCNKAKFILRWKCILSFSETVEMTVNWYKHFFSYGTMERLSREQIDFFTNK